MPLNPHVKGGSDVPVTDGGTGASDAGTGLTNLGGLSSAAHATENHAGIPGVGDLTTAAHGTLDHAGITGVGDTTRLGFSVPGNTLATNDDMIEWEASGGSVGAGSVQVTFGDFLANFSTSFAGAVVLRGTVVRTGATSAYVSCTIDAEENGNATAPFINTSASITWANVNNFATSAGLTMRYAKLTKA